MSNNTKATYSEEEQDATGIESSRQSLVDWTPGEERLAKRKLDLTIMPLLALGLFCLQLDRGNIANAITETFLDDVKITQDQFNVGQQLLSLGIVLFEIPSNMILYRIGPGKWLTIQLFLFGIVSTFQAFQTNYGSYLATRLLLGITESGYIPGALWTLSTWYTRAETAKRVVIFYFGNMFASACAKLFAYGILYMRGVGGKPGWFWLFVLMGAFTVLSGFILGCFLPNSFKKPHSTFFPRWHIFTEREIHILRTRVRQDDPAKGRKQKTIGLPAFKKTFGNWRLWIHFFITLCNNGPQRGFDTYAPSLVQEAGFLGLQANALASVGLFLQIPVAFVFSFVSDRFDMRGETVIVGLSMTTLAYVLNRIFTDLNNRGAQFFGVVWTQIFSFFPHSLNVAWMSLTCTDSEERALAMAMVVMGANMAGIYGAQIFRSDDKPRYRRAFIIGIAIMASATLLAIIRKVDEVINGKKGSGYEENESEPSTEGEVFNDVRGLPAVPAPVLIDTHGRASISGTTR